MKSVMTHQFSRVPAAEIQRSSFNRSHGFKTTLDAGWLVPMFCDEVLPGDSFNLNMTAFCRLATPLHPFMDNMFISSFFFFVPYRLIWSNWEKMNGEQDNPGDSTDFLVPICTSTAVTGYSVGSLQDFFGLPTGIPGLDHSALPLRAYNLIWNEWFRDQNLQNSLIVLKTDGPDPVANYALQRRGKRHDYFTSALPWPQKGPAVGLPLGTTAPVIRNAAQPYPYFMSPAAQVNRLTAKGTNNQDVGIEANPGAAGLLQWGTNGSGTGLVTDLSTATAATINQLRQAFQIQRMYEHDARGGTRYTEVIRAHFGVVSPDARLQRPEYLGGGVSPINVSPVVQQSATGATGTTSPQGNLAAMGTSTMKRHGFTKSFTEHGVIIGLISINADLTYQQGLNRMWSRRTRFDFYWPTLAHIGEQAVLNKEIYAQGTGNPTQDAAAFGYQERFAEYRYKPSQITGQFRSTYAQTLDTWHLSQKFTSLPALNSSFIVDDPPVDRVIAVPAEPHLLFDAFFDLKCARPMPVFGVPGLIDHF